MGHNHEGHEGSEDITTSDSTRHDTFESVLQVYMSRRTLLKSAIASLGLAYASPLTRPSAAAGPDGFMPLTHSTEDKLFVPDGYQYNVLIRWGDPVLPDTPGFDPRAQQSAIQARQFGYNADFIGFLPLPVGSGNSEHGLLVVNHEYTNPEPMFADWDGKDERKTREMVDIELAAHGLSVIEIQRDAKGGWSYAQNSSFNRRLTAETLIALSGPAAGHSWLKTSSDASGTRVQGTVSNCAGGVTPWGTVLTAEENFQQYFGGSVEAIGDQTVQALHKRYEVRDEYGWGRHYDRFDVTKEPHEPLRFGWIVEIDPYDPTSMPMKRTALGRFTHEAATTVINKDGRAVVYMGDDGRFEYLYKFVSTGRYDPSNRAATRKLLDAGTLYVAKFRDNGIGEWMPLIFGQGPLIAANGFNSQGDVLIGTRRAADLLQATKMDRPEDVEANPRSGKVYVVMTNNTRRRPEQVDKANPRPENKHGHIIELVEDGGEHTATAFGWDLFIACGDPNNPGDNAFYQGHKDTSWLSCPDNIAFDDAGRLWIATDGQAASIKKNDVAIYRPDGGKVGN
jgi:secreted PhoX family phosphatase